MPEEIVLLGFGHLVDEFGCYLDFGLLIGFEELWWLFVINRLGFELVVLDKFIELLPYDGFEFFCGNLHF